MFNSKKTTCMRIGSNGDPPARAVSLNGSPLTWTRRIKHLGNIITCDLKDSEDITFKKGAFISQVNRLNCKMSEVSGNVKGQLLWKRISVMVCKKSAYTNCSGRVITAPEEL